MVIYEITATVDSVLIPEYEIYMRETHIPDVLATGRFSNAFFTRSAANRYRIFYFAESQNDLKEYVQNEAPALRADFAGHFLTGIELGRENWEVLERFDVES